VNNFVGPVSRHENRAQQDLRLDHHLNDAAQVFVRYSRSSDKIGQGSLFGPPANGYPNLSSLPQLEQSPLIDTPSAQSLVVGHTNVFSNTLVNDLRAGYIRSTAYTQSPTTPPLFEDFGIKGISPFPDLTGLPVFTIAGFGVLGDRRIMPERHQVGVVQLTDRVSWVHRAHSVTVGGEMHFKNREGYGSFLSRGEFVFIGQFTSRVRGVGSGSALADLLLGQTSMATLNNRLDYAFQDSSYALYAQDTWRVSPQAHRESRSSLRAPDTAFGTAESDVELRPRPCESHRWDPRSGEGWRPPVANIQGPRDQEPGTPRGVGLPTGSAHDPPRGVRDLLRWPRL
jgi:hypothetical protein